MILWPDYAAPLCSPTTVLAPRAEPGELRYTSKSMVAIGTHLQPPPALPMPNPVVSRMGYGPVRFTIRDALGMVENGILPEDGRVELLDGSLIYRDRFDLHGSEVVEGVKHSYVVAALARLSREINTADREVRTQCTLICNETHAPIPDGLIVRGTFKDYRDRLPTVADALCVIEVADSSYERDAGEKLIGYARAGVAQYIIVNLRNRTAEIYTTPDATAGTYPPPRIVLPQEMISFRVATDEFFDVRLTDLLP